MVLEEDIAKLLFQNSAFVEAYEPKKRLRDLVDNKEFRLLHALCYQLLTEHYLIKHFEIKEAKKQKLDKLYERAKEKLNRSFPELKEMSNVAEKTKQQKTIEQLERDQHWAQNFLTSYDSKLEEIDNDKTCIAVFQQACEAFTAFHEIITSTKFMNEAEVKLDLYFSEKNLRLVPLQKRPLITNEVYENVEIILEETYSKLQKQKEAVRKNQLSLETNLKQSSHNLHWIVGAITSVAVLIAGTYLFWPKQQNNNESNQTKVSNNFQIPKSAPIIHVGPEDDYLVQYGFDPCHPSGKKIYFVSLHNGKKYFDASQLDKIDIAFLHDKRTGGFDNKPDLLITIKGDSWQHNYDIDFDNCQVVELKYWQFFKRIKLE